MRRSSNDQTTSQEGAAQSERSQWPPEGAKIEILHVVGEKRKEDQSEMDQILSYFGSRVNDNQSVASRQKSHQMINDIEFKACTIPPMGKEFE